MSQDRTTDGALLLTRVVVVVQKDNIRIFNRVGVNMAMTYACGKTVVDVEKVVDVVRSAGAAIMQVYTEDAKV